MPELSNALYQNMNMYTYLPHAEPEISVLGLEVAVVGLDDHALVAPRRLPRVQLLVLQLVVGGNDALGGPRVVALVVVVVLGVVVRRAHHAVVPGARLHQLVVQLVVQPLRPPLEVMLN